jgi:hypothetical protein
MTPTIDELVVGDEPASWERAGFAVDGDGVVAIGAIRVRLVGRGGGKGIRSWSLRGVAVSSIDGIETTESHAEPPAPGVHPNGSVTVDHVVVMSADPPRTTAALEQVGLDPRRTRSTESYGSPMTQTFFKAGDLIVELVGPQTPSDDPSPAAFFGLAITVDDLDRTAEALGDLLGAVKDAVQEGRRIATLRHRDCGMSVATAFMSGPGASRVTSRPSG